MNLLIIMNLYLTPFLKEINEPLVHLFFHRKDKGRLKDDPYLFSK